MLTTNDRTALSLGMTHHITFAQFPAVYVSGIMAVGKAIREIDPNGKATIRDLVTLDRLNRKIVAI